MAYYAILKVVHFQIVIWWRAICTLCKIVFRPEWCSLRGCRLEVVVQYLTIMVHLTNIRKVTYLLWQFLRCVTLIILCLPFFQPPSSCQQSSSFWLTASDSWQQNALSLVRGKRCDENCEILLRSRWLWCGDWDGIRWDEKGLWSPSRLESTQR